jgi:hypothetical protein
VARQEKKLPVTSQNDRLVPTPQFVLRILTRATSSQRLVLPRTPVTSVHEARIHQMRGYGGSGLGFGMKPGVTQDDDAFFLCVGTRWADPHPDRLPLNHAGNRKEEYLSASSA